jgi:hypothetical protein
VNPVNGVRYQYNFAVEEFNISPFAQFTPIHTSSFDFIIRAGARIGYYNQVFNEGACSYLEPIKRFEVDFIDIRYKEINAGYDLGFEVRFQADKFVRAPSIIFANDLNASGYSAHNFR